MDQTSEKFRLQEHYGKMADGELEDVASEAFDLTDVAREALIAETQKRGLAVEVQTARPASIEPPEPVVIESEPEEEESEGVLEYQDLVMVHRFRDLHEAMLVRGVLDSAGIKCFLADDNMIRMDWFISNLIGGIKLMVRPEDLEAAQAVIDQPIPEGIDYGSEEHFKQPKCPRCGSLNITFEELNKPLSYGSAFIGLPLPIASPKWRCEECEARWVEEEEETHPEEEVQP